MKKIIFAIMIFAIPTFSYSQADNWIEIAKDKNNNAVFMKNTVANIDEYGIQVWVKQTVPSFKTVKGVLYKNVTMKTLYSFNCAKNKIQSRAIIVYTSKGASITSYKRPEYENSLDYEDVVPESLGEQILNKACELFNN